MRLLITERPCRHMRHRVSSARLPRPAAMPCIVELCAARRLAEHLKVELRQAHAMITQHQSDHTATMADAEARMAQAAEVSRAANDHLQSALLEINEEVESVRSHVATGLHALPRLHAQLLSAHVLSTSLQATHTSCQQRC
jgi:hypothetical protein